MSDSVVISKGLLDSILTVFENLGGNLLLDELRAAPETVSLEGVEKLVWDRVHGSEIAGQDIDDLIDDLRRLAATVQPSAVVSRETIEGGIISVKDHHDPESWERLIDLIHALQLPQPVAHVQPSAVVSREAIDEAITSADPDGEHFGITRKEQDLIVDSVALLQLPQPVTPVQGGGVDIDSLMANIDEWSIPFSCLDNAIDQETVFANFDQLIDDLKGEIKTHLTTTQSAPSVPKWALDSQIEITNDLRKRLESLENMTARKIGGVDQKKWDELAKDNEDAVKRILAKAGVPKLFDPKHPLATDPEAWKKRESAPSTEDNSKELISIIRKACGYIENGTAQTVHIFQDDATKTWLMTAGNWPKHHMEAYSEYGNMEDAIKSFEIKYKDVLE